MLELVSLTKSFGSRTLFRSVSLCATPHQKIALVGPPGSGKTTLVRIILGFESYSGQVYIPPLAWFGYLPQEPVPTGDYVLADVLRLARQHARALRWRMRGSDWPFDEPVQHNGGPEWSEQQILTDLGLNNLPLKTHLSSLSLAAQKCVWLASVLLARPDFLILDATFDDLSLEIIGRIRKYLRQYEGTILVATQNPCALSGALDAIWEIDPEEATIRVHPGYYWRRFAEKNHRVPPSLSVPPRLVVLPSS